MTTPDTPSLLDELLSSLVDDDDGVHGDANGTSNPADTISVPTAPTPTTAGIASRGAPSTESPLTLHGAPSAVAADVVDLAEVRQQRRNARADLVVEGLHGARECVAVIRETFASKTADFDDAVKALPVLHRLIEHVEKIEAARNVRPALPTLHIEFKGLGFVVHPTTAAESAPRLLDGDS